MSEITMTNGDLKASLDALVELCGQPNRLAIVPGLQASRNKQALATAWEPVEELRAAAVTEFADEGQNGISADDDGWVGFVEAFSALMLASVTVSLDVMKVSDIEAGYTREANGMKGALAMAPDSIGHLVALGIVTEDGKPLQAPKPIEEDVADEPSTMAPDAPAEVAAT